MRQKVKIWATLSAAPDTDNVYVIFKRWDVDDPSSSTAPLDEDDDDPDPNKHSIDNRGSSYFIYLEEPKQLTYVWPESGSNVVDANFYVSYQPGDNYRITATTRIVTEHNGITHCMVETGSLPSTVKRSEMLTTWRKLHIEFDTMNAPTNSVPFGIVTGTATKITPSGLEAPGCTWGWPDTMIGGVLDPDGTSPGISVDYVNKNTFEVIGNSDTIAIVIWDYRGDHFDNDGINGRDDAGEVFKMSDYAADPANVEIGINTDDPLWRTDLNPPSISNILSGMNGYYNDAYIKVQEQTTGNAHPSFGFIRMTNAQQATVDVPGDSLYWTVCVGWAYEHSYVKGNMCPEGCDDHQFYYGDDDPEDEGVPTGYMASVVGKAASIPGERCMIYRENLRDRGSTNIPKTVSHEVGHCLDLYHSTWTPETGFEAVRDGIMGWQDVYGYIPCKKEWIDLVRAHTSPDRFSDYHIDKIRSSAID